MKWNLRVRQLHRWLSMIFTGTVVAIFGLLGAGQQPPQWAYYTPLPPLALLLLSGLFLFFLPYAARRRSGRSARA